MARTLTEAMVRDMAVAPGAKLATLRDKDAHGFFVRCYATGRKSFFYEYRDAQGRMQTVWIGSFPSISVKDARKAARGHAGDRANSRDPAAEKREERRKVQSSLAILLAVDGRYERALKARHVVNAKQTLSALRRGLPKLMARDVATFTRQDIVAAINVIAATGKEGAADDLRKHARRFQEWCVEQGLCPANPMSGWRRPKETRAQLLGKKERGRALADAEISAVWNAAADPANAFGGYGGLVQAALLTGARRGELAKLKWDHVASDRIRLIEAHTKTGKAHEYPITPLLRSILAAQGRSAGNDLVFRSRVTGCEIDGWHSLLTRLRAVSVVHLGLHDCRRTVRTRLNDPLNCDSDLRKLFIGPARDPLDAKYDKSERWAARVAAAERLSDHIAAIVNAETPHNVVALPAA